MAKQLLQNYRIGSDIIDRLGSIPSSPNSGGASPESPPVGAKPEELEVVSLVAEDTEPQALAAEQELPAAGTELLTCKRDGLFYLFTIGGVIYRLGGVRPLFVTSLKVNLRASAGEASYYDSLDLYTARARSSFAGALQRTWGAEPSRVEKDLILILEYLESERDAALTAGSSAPKINMSEAEKQAGLELLRDPALFQRIDRDLAELGYVGEELNKQLLYLCASSRKLEDPLSVLIVSQSASGKSFLVDCVKKLMPAEEVVCVTSLSDQALNYIDDLSHKFLILGEAVHGEVVEHQIREMLSGKELSRLVTVKDPETGKMQSKVIRTPVIVASVMSTTNNHVNPENASRCFVVNTDESKDQTARIHEHQRQKYSLEHLQSGPASIQQIIRTHQAAQRLLEPVSVVNDFAPLLDFPVHLMRLRRDHDRFLDLIACVCFLRQFQKRRETAGGLSFIRCDLEDYKIAWKIMTEGIMQATVQELPEAAHRLYEELRSWVKDQAKAQNLRSEEYSFTQRQVREFTGLGHTWIKYTLRTLTEYEYLAMVKGGERSKAFYRLREDREIALVDVSRILTPEAMALKLQNISEKLGNWAELGQ